MRYLSILPTNHAIDFMVGFLGPFVCGAAVVHLRTLRPEYVREAFTRYKITYMSLVPMVLKNLENGLRERFAALPPTKRTILNGLIGLNRRLTRRKPNLELSRKLLGQVHNAFGGELRALFVGGAFTEPATLQFFYDLGIPVANGYGLTEAGTALTLNDFNPFRPDTVGKPLPGVEMKIVRPDTDGVGEVAVRGNTVMSHYLDDPELTAETIVDGWLMTGDQGRLDASGHLQLFGRQEEHDRDRGRQEHLSRRHRNGVRGDAGKGILHLCGALPLAEARRGRVAGRTAGRTVGRGRASGNGGRAGRRIAEGTGGAQPDTPRLQAAERVRAVECGLPANGISENQTGGTG